MSVFPQLHSGAVVQFPFRATYRRRTIVNELQDGQAIRFQDGGTQRVEWRIEFADLTVAESEALRRLHAEMEGRVGTFAFFDPNANLAAWSEDIERPVWTKDPFITLTPGVADPEGGTNAQMLANAGVTDQRVVQRLAIPETFETSMSVWLRSSVSQSANLVRQSERKEVSVGLQWRRVQLCGRGSGSDDETDFGISIAAGASVEVYGVQVEAQPVPSSYKRNEAATGIHRKARFSSDSLEIWSDGAGRYRAVVAVQSSAGVA